MLPEGISSMDLRDLYIDITSAIREVDQNHIIYIEGNWYGTDFTNLTPPWDENMSYAFHKYWGDVTINTIQSYLSMSNNYNIPLWLGETGENSNHWYYEIVKLCENNNIGWNWWTHKKIEKTKRSIIKRKFRFYKKRNIKIWKRKRKTPKVPRGNS